MCLPKYLLRIFKNIRHKNMTKFSYLTILLGIHYDIYG